MDLREIGLGGVDWIRLTQDKDRWRAVVSAVMKHRVLAGEVALFEIVLGLCVTISTFILWLMAYNKMEQQTKTKI
jgi:hypothetical protein